MRQLAIAIALLFATTIAHAQTMGININKDSSLQGTGSVSSPLGVNTANIQARVSGTCSAGSAMRVIASNGTVTCEAFASAGSISGTTNTLAKFTASNAVGDSQVTDDGTTITVGAADTRVVTLDNTGLVTIRHDDNGLQRKLVIDNRGITGAGQGPGILFGLAAGGAASAVGVSLDALSENATHSGATADASLSVKVALDGTLLERLKIQSDGLSTFTGTVRSTVGTGVASIVAETSSKSWTVYPIGNDLRLFEYTTTFLSGGGNDRVTFEAGGFVGVGITNPAAKLHVLGSGGTSGLTPNAGSVIAVDNTGSDSTIGFLNNTSDQGFLFGNASSVADGRLLYTTARAFDFYAAGASRMALDSSTLDANVDLAKFGGGADGYTYIAGDSLNFYYASNANALGLISWHGYLDGVTQFRDTAIGNGKAVAIATFQGSTGNVGIADSTPAEARLVVGAGASTENILIKAGSGWADLMLWSASTNGGSIYWSDNSGSSNPGEIFYNHSDDSLTFKTATSARLAISSSGTTTSTRTVGTTMVATETASNVFLRDDTAMAASVGGALLLGGKYTSGGAYAEGASIKAFKTNGTDSNYSFDLVFGTRPNGGNITERLRISDSGAINGNGSWTLGTGTSPVHTAFGRFEFRGDAATNGVGVLLRFGSSIGFNNAGETAAGSIGVSTNDITVTAPNAAGQVILTGTGGVSANGPLITSSTSTTAIQVASTMFLVSGSTGNTEAAGTLAVGGNATLGNANTDMATIWGHKTTRGTAPTLSSCGTSPTITGTDQGGRFATGTSGTTCTITFSRTYTSVPACVIFRDGNATGPVCTTSATAITCTTTVASTTYNYICSCNDSGCT